MKRLLIVLFLLISSSILLFADNWVAIKAGIGNETAGFGGALEIKVNRGGFVFGIGSINNSLRLSTSGKYYLVLNEENSIFLSLGYGTIVFDEEFGLEEYSIYGPFLMLGTSISSGRGLGETSLGISYSHDRRSIMLAIQASLGFIFQIF